MGRAAALAVIVAAAAACSVDSQEAPSLIGPSGFGQSVTLSATPDRLPRDGSSQAVVTVTVRNESGQPVSGQRLSVGASMGSLSASDVVTGPDGRTTFTVTAPTAGAIGGSILEVFATPVGGNFDDAVTRTLSIALMGAANTTAPAPQFTVTPADPDIGDLVTFDASATTDEGGACGTACTYTWNFDDGSTASGLVVTHTFTSAGSRTIVLTVRDVSGTTAAAQRVLTISSVLPPTVTFSVSPTSPIVGREATFTANATPGSGHRITQYTWNFGDGSGTQTTATNTVTKVFTSAGTRVVTVTATDDLGQSSSASSTVTVGTGVTVAIRVSPTNPVVGQTVRFDPLESAVPNGVGVQEYRWDFGNGDTDVTTPSSPVAETSYGSAQTFTVRLTIVDTQGRTTTGFATVTVTNPTP
jgi:PKD repeat protein